LYQGKSTPIDCLLFPKSKPNLGGYKFKEVCKVETFVTRSLIKQHGIASTEVETSCNDRINASFLARVVEKTSGAEVEMNLICPCHGLK